jgi:hypothetical protein
MSTTVAVQDHVALDRRTAVNRPLVFLVNLAELEVLRIPHDLKLALGQVTEGGGNQVSEGTLVNSHWKLVSLLALEH